MKKVVIIPTYNERENIAAMIAKVFSLAEPFDMLVVDDGSPDGTAAIVREHQAKFPERLFMLERSGKLGLGTAYMTGFRWALERGYDYVFEMDCDFSHNPDDLVRLYRAAAGESGAENGTASACEARREGRSPQPIVSGAIGGADMVVGSRYIEGVNVVNWPMERLLMSYFASRYVRMATGMPVRDATAGFVGYSRKVLETMELDSIKMKGYGFQIEMKYTAWKLGFRIKEVSIIFTERREGQSKMSGGIFREAFWGVMGLRFRKIRRKQ